MALYELQGPDGKMYEIEAPDVQSAATAFQEMARPKAPQLSELDQRMDARVAKEAAAGLTPRPNPAEYLPFGSWLDEASAGIDAGLNWATGGKAGQPYEDAKAYQNARQRYVKENASGLEKGAAIAGGMAASLPFGAVRLMRGATLVPQTVNAAATGAAYGGIYGAGEGEGVERIDNALTGAKWGAATGAAVAPASQGVANLISHLRNRRAPLPAQLQGLERGAVNRVADDMATSGVDANSFTRQSRELGPEGMLLDMGDDLRGSAETLANTHGPQLPVVRGELNARRNAAPGRIEAAIDRELGPQVNLPQYVESQRQTFSRAARPFYDQFYGSQIEQSPELARTLSQLPRSVFTKAEQLARADGIRQRFRLRPVDEAMTPMTGVQGSRAERIHQGVEYDYLKRAVDDMARAAEPGSNEARIYGTLARNLRNQVDEILSPGAPDQSPWAIARRTAGDGLEGREAAELGGGVFSGKRDPNMVEAELGDLSQYGQRMYRYGARNDLRQIMGRGATNFGPRGDNGARRALNSEFSRQNLAQIAGPNQAVRLTQTIDAENRMAESFNEIMTNSATARRQAGQSRLPVGAGAPINTEAPRTLNELAFMIARRGVNALMNGFLGERAGRIMADQARLLTARGIDRDTYVQALLRLSQSRQMSAQQRQVIESMLTSVGQQARTPIIDSRVRNRGISGGIGPRYDDHGNLRPGQSQ